MKAFTLFLLFFSSLSSLQALQVSNLSTLEKLELGEKKRVSLTLINDKDEEEKVDLKLSDYACNSQGDHFYDDPNGKKARSNASWILLGQERVILAPREEREIYFVIEVPEDMTQQGSFWSCLLIEPTETYAQGDNKAGLSLRIKIRFAHHIVTQVGEGTPKIKILKKEIVTLEGTPHLCLHVLNQGSLFYNPALTATFYDEEGNLERKITTQPERLYPDCSQCFYVSLADYPKDKLNKPLQGFLLFDGNDSHLFGDRFTYP